MSHTVVHVQIYCIGQLHRSHWRGRGVSLGKHTQRHFGQISQSPGALEMSVSTKITAERYSQMLWLTSLSSVVEIVQKSKFLNIGGACDSSVPRAPGTGPMSLCVGGKLGESGVQMFRWLSPPSLCAPQGREAGARCPILELPRCCWCPAPASIDDYTQWVFFVSSASTP